MKKQKQAHLPNYSNFLNVSHLGLKVIANDHVFVICLDNKDVNVTEPEATLTWALIDPTKHRTGAVKF